MPLEWTVLGYIKTNNNNTANEADDANTVITIDPTYDANASNVNGGNRNILDLTGNTQVIEDNNIGQNTRKNYVRKLTDIMVCMVDDVPENSLIVKPSEVKTQGTWVFQVRKILNIGIFWKLIANCC